MFGLAAIPSLLGAAVRVFFMPLLDPMIWPGLALVAALSFGWGWWKGDAHGDRQCEVRIARDKADQEAKIREEGEKTDQALEDWRREKERGNELERQLADAARKDPNAGRACGGGVGMRDRINRIKGKPARSR